MMCERCGKRRPLTHTVPMKSGARAMVCEACWSYLMAVYGGRERTTQPLLPALDEWTGDSNEIATRGAVLVPPGKRGGGAAGDR